MSDVDAALVKHQAERCGKLACESQIAVGFLAAQSVVQVGRMQHQAQFLAPPGKNPQQRHRIRTAREPNRQPKPRLQQCGVNRQFAGLFL
jgi:hypothetical protein